MSAVLNRTWTREEFFDWAEAQDERYEFDGFEPVAMTGGNAVHSQLHGNIVFALRSRLPPEPCRVLGPDAGVAVGTAVRYPDALITCTPFANEARTVPGVVVLFEVISPTSGRLDRITKVRDYASVPSIRRYVIIESTGIGLTVFSRVEAGQDWTAHTLAEGDTLDIPEAGIALPLSDIYAQIKFPAA